MVEKMNGEILVERQGTLAYVTLSFPGKFNAMSRRMWRDLRTTFRSFQHEQSLRCIVIRGAGGHFCAGGDISEYPQFRYSESGLREFHEEDVWGGLSAVLDCDIPIVAQIEGNCMGAGLEIACCCDIRIASSTSKFGAPIGHLGFPMAPREAALVLRETGALTARELLLEAGIISAESMLQRGFLHRSVVDATLIQEVAASVRRIIQLAPLAARRNKQALRALLLDRPDTLAALLQGAYAYADSPEHREGIDAFLAKRKPGYSQ